MDFIRWARLAVAGVLSLPVPAGVAQALMIDDFTQGPIVIEPTSTSFWEQQSELDPNHALGGDRLIQGVHVLDDIRIEVDTSSPGTFNVTTPSTADPYGVFTVWFIHPTLSSPADLTVGGADAIAIDVVSASFGSETSVEFASRIQDVSGTYVNIPVSLHASEAPYTIVVPFSAWETDDGAPDFSVVTLLGFGNHNAPAGPLPPGSSLVIDSVYTIPEPASLTLLGLGGVAMLWRRRAASAA